MERTCDNCGGSLITKRSGNGILNLSFLVGGDNNWRSGTNILLVQNLWIGIGKWGVQRYREIGDETRDWVDLNGHSASGSTHWMPLPSPPVIQGADQEQR